MNRRLLGSAIFAGVVALSAAIALGPVTTPTAGSSATGAGVTLDSSVVELVAAPTSSPCNAGGGRGNGTGHCPTPTPSPTSAPSPTPTSCPGSCKPLLSESRSGAIVHASTMKPGDVATGSVVITANGNVYVSLLEGSVTHSGPAGSGNLAHRLTLAVSDQTMGLQVYSGTLDSMPASISLCGDGPPPHEACQRWGKNESHTFSFVVTFPNAGTDSDNVYQETSASADLVWGATR